MKVRMTLTGTAPLLLHNARLSDPLDPIAREMKKVSSKRVKTEEDHEELARLEFLGGLYWDSGIGVFLPGANIEKCMVEAGRITKQGKAIERGLFVEQLMVPLVYEGPRKPDELWAAMDETGQHVYSSRMSVGVGQQRVMRTRPKFDQWSAVADATIDTTVIDLSALRDIASRAGEMVGLGDYRPRFGRFHAEVEKAG